MKNELLMNVYKIHNKSLQDVSDIATLIMISIFISLFFIYRYFIFETSIGDYSFFQGFSVFVGSILTFVLILCTVCVFQINRFNIHKTVLINEKKKEYVFYEQNGDDIFNIYIRTKLDDYYNLGNLSTRHSNTIMDEVMLSDINNRIYRLILANIRNDENILKIISNLNNK